MFEFCRLILKKPRSYEVFFSSFLSYPCYNYYLFHNFVIISNKNILILAEIECMKQIALISGASSGIGKETTKLLLQKGYIVYGAARNIDKMHDILSLGAKILTMDVSDDASMCKGIDEIIQTEGRIDVLINNAGFGFFGSVEDVSMSDAKYQMEVNVFGLARLTQLVLPYMRWQHYGKIVNISSIAGKVCMPFGAWYHASKFAVEGLSNSLRMDVKSFGIDVIVIEPGSIKSEWGHIAMENLRKVSKGGAYGDTAKKMSDKFPKFEANNAKPSVIANLILKAITAKNPKTRYSGGYLAGLSLIGHKILPDKLLDKIMMKIFQ